MTSFAIANVVDSPSSQNTAVAALASSAKEEALAGARTQKYLDRISDNTMVGTGNDEGFRGLFTIAQWKGDDRNASVEPESINFKTDIETMHEPHHVNRSPGQRVGRDQGPLDGEETDRGADVWPDSRKGIERAEERV